MTQRLTPTVVAAFIAMLLIAPGAVAGQTTAGKAVADITLVSKPNPPKTGANTFEVTVKGPDGKAVTDGDVSITFFMAAMPSMKMPEMKNSVTLKHVKDGRYSGSGNVMMAGKWEATVSVKRAGKEIASKKFPITAK
jgi:hypothetical protein